MKHTIDKYFLFILVIFSGASCTDFLDNAPDGEITLEMVFNDRNRTEEWLATVYSGIPDPYTRMMQNYDAYADDYAPSPGWEPYNWDCISKIKGNWNSESAWNGDFWMNLPIRIRQAYILIDNVKPLPDQYSDSEKKNAEGDAANMKAEARFLIAYYYYLLVNTYGAIPLQTWLSDFDDQAEDLMIGQNPFDEVISWVDNELQEVAKILPTSYTEKRKYGRATSIMALAVRARMLLFAASPLVNGNSDSDYSKFTNNKGQHIFNSTYEPQKWEKAMIACKELIDAAHACGHQLYYEYNTDGTIDPFMSYSNMCYVEEYQGNKEILFPRPLVDYQFMQGHAAPRGSNGQGGLGVTQSLVDAFFMSNGLPPILGYEINRQPIINTASGYTEKGFSTTTDKRKTRWIEGSPDAKTTQEYNTVVPANIFNMYVNREPRFYVSVLFNGAWYKESERYLNFLRGEIDGKPLTGSVWDAPQNGYLLRKRMHPNTSIRYQTHIYRPGILFRLAEAYLNYAEALNEWDPNQKSEIVKYINLVRERAGIPIYGSESDQIQIPATQDGMRDIIKRERRVEFNCEYAIRYDDIRRWQEMDLLRGDFDGMNADGSVKSDNTNNPDAYFVRKVYLTRAFSEKNYWIPIHQNQLDKNQNLRQIPKW